MAPVDTIMGMEIQNLAIPAHYFAVSTEYHSDDAFPKAMQQFLDLTLSAAALCNIRWDNCTRLYRIPTSAPLVRPVVGAFAAH